MDEFKSHVGEYVIFDGANTLFTKSFDQAIKVGEKIYGENTAFIVRKVGAVPLLSNLVKK